MAASKALLAEQWWEEISGAGKNLRVLPLSYPKRVRFQEEVPAEKADNSEWALAESSLYGRPGKQFQSTAHASQRMAERNLSEADVEYVLLHGQTWHKAGAIITCLRRKDIPHADLVKQRQQKLAGTIVVATGDGANRVLTVYRNRRSGLGHIKRKGEYGW